MNCQDFQELLFDYVDGTVPASRRSEIDQHLAVCGECRESLEEHRRLAREFSGRLRQSAQSLSLTPETRRRMVAALLSPSAEASQQPNAASARSTSVRRAAFKWSPSLQALAGVFGPAVRRWAAAGCLLAVLVLIGGLWLGPHGAGSSAAAAEPQVTLSAQVPQVFTIYTFQREEQFVTDTMITRAEAVRETFQPKPSSKPSVKTPVNKRSL
jgi:anti-sigma factor RsiW